MKVTEPVFGELETIRKQHGGILRPVDVVEYAKTPETALHSQFEWDDTKAATEYRLEQARRVIRFTVTVLGTDTREIRAYVSLSTDRQQGDSYRSMEEVLSDPSSRARLLAQALSEADSWRTRYDRLAELSPIVAAIKKIQEKKQPKPRKAKTRRREPVLA